MSLISQGAEATVYLEDGFVIKKRQPKTYRNAQLDRKLRVFRTRREAKVLKKLEELGVAVPALRTFSDTPASITMEYVEGKKLRDVLNEKNGTVLCREIGNAVGTMHSNGIIHGDLTTSNMMVRDGKIVFIDFGLSFFSEKDEDKAVDIHLFKQALASSHARLSEKCLPSFFEGYAESNQSGEGVCKRLEQVETRGRNKRKKITSQCEAALRRA
jgi:TP53 regulating kinase and related kinases